MAFSEEDKVQIESLYVLKGHNTRQSAMEFPHKGWKKCSTSRSLQKLRNDCTVDSDLKQRLADTWASSSRNIIDEPVDQCHLTPQYKYHSVASLWEMAILGVSELRNP